MPRIHIKNTSSLYHTKLVYRKSFLYTISFVGVPKIYKKHSIIGRILFGHRRKIEPKVPQKVSITDLFSCLPVPRICFDFPNLRELMPKISTVCIHVRDNCNSASIMVKKPIVCRNSSVVLICKLF